MACVYPIDAWYSSRLNESGKRGLVFNPRDGFTDRPLQVPCGKCVGCSKERAKIWGIRMYHEASQHERNSFVTLTYAQPPAKIDKRDLQCFFKRLRKLRAVRYFACGEYGTLTHRPHYHAVIFGEDFRGGAIQINDTLWSNDELSDSWGKGIVSAGDVTLQSCMYVAGYVNKKAGDPDTFNLMSRRPGIGHSWLDKYASDIERTEVISIEGREYSVPKKYLEWREFDKLKAKRKAHYANRTPDEVIRARVVLRAREKNYKSSIKQNGETL